MKRKNLMTALMCSVCLAVAPATSMAVMAEETEAVTEAPAETEAQTEGAEAETAGQEETTADEESTEAESEETEAPIERPEYTALDYVTLGEYKGLVVTTEPVVVTEEDIDSSVRTDVKLADALEAVEDATVEEGDTANIDYEGKLDGEAFEGGTSKGYDLEIGSNTFIDGFEDGLVGVKVGETVDIPLTFPENYGSEELAGQDVVFTVTVNEVKRMPELTDELVNTITDGEYTDVQSYRDSIRTSLEANMETEKENKIMTDILTQLTNICEIKEYPQEMVDYGVDNLVATYTQYAAQYEMEFADFIESFFGMTEEEFMEEAELAAQQNLQQELYLKAVAEAEGLELSDEEFAETSENYAQMYGYESADELIAAYGESTVRISALQDKAMEFLRENAVIEEAEAESETGAENETEAGSETEAESETEAVGDAAEQSTEA